ncbi:TrkA C-terminal domain-containing protein, partial [Bacillus thuringiensis]|uniref:TrkA C-terminal domain-containing protein n=1 Tax=Bacillus thuringiensis TaxID=1428 RepID=UPI003BF6A506
AVPLKEDIQVLFVTRGERNLRSDLRDLILQEGDELLLYGEKQLLEETILQQSNVTKYM